MMFMMPEKDRVLFVFLEHEDAMKLKDGNTLFVDPRMTGGRLFHSVILSLHRSKDEIVKMIRMVDPAAKIPDHLPEPPPREGELKCAGCGGSTRPEGLFENQCITCWAKEAKRFRAQSN